MTSQSGGGGGIKGVTSDGQTPGGEVVAGAVHAGDSAAANLPTFHRFYGDVTIQSVPGTDVDGDDVLDLNHFVDLTADSIASALFCGRSGLLNGHDTTAPVVVIEDLIGGSGPTLRAIREGTTVLEITTQKSITGALASVTDANAKAVLTSIIAALTGIKVATNDTT